MERQNIVFTRSAALLALLLAVAAVTAGAVPVGRSRTRTRGTALVAAKAKAPAPVWAQYVGITEAELKKWKNLAAKNATSDLTTW